MRNCHYSEDVLSAEEHLRRRRRVDLELYSNDTDNEKGKLTWKQTAKAVLNDENY
jgi:hypothetical protein